MAPRWPPDTLVLTVGRAVHMWQTPAASLALFPLRSSHCRVHVRPSVHHKFGRLGWKSPLTTRSWGRKGWLCRARLHTSTLCLNTSTSRWFPGLSQHMSRIRSTLDTVSKAVSGTHTELKSKIARLKPAASQAGKEFKDGGATETTKTDQGTISPLSPDPSHVHSVSAATTAPNSTTQTPLPVEEALQNTSVPSQDDVQTTVIATAPSELDLKEKSLGNVVAAANSPGAVKKQEGKEGQVNVKETKSITISKPTAPPQLFHPSTFSVSLDETYSYLANHVNNYFGSTTTTQEKASTSIQGRKSSSLTPVSNNKGLESTATSSPSAQKKGFGHYLSYSAPTVQAFVGNYIRPLVPKFRAVEPKSAEVVQEKVEDVQAKPAVAAVTRELNATEERAKRLLLQREKVCLHPHQLHLLQCIYPTHHRPHLTPQQPQLYV